MRIEEINNEIRISFDKDTLSKQDLDSILEKIEIEEYNKKKIDLPERFVNRISKEIKHNISERIKKDRPWLFENYS
jgi:predicted metalloprotease